MPDAVALALADVGSNCDLACFLASLFSGLAIATGYEDYRNWRINKRYEHDRDARNEAWDLYRKAGGYGPPPPLVLRRNYPPGSDVDVLMRWYKFYQDVAIFIGGEEKKSSMPAGKA